jgi:predicted nucleic acid-binding Zn ribbon protein
VRRRAPRPLAAALGRVTQSLEPPTLLARVQGCWADVVGETLNEEAEPVSEREGAVTIACRSSVWAEELKMMGPDLRQRLNAALGDDAVAELRFTAAGTRRRPL